MEDFEQQLAGVVAESALLRAEFAAKTAGWVWCSEPITRTPFNPQQARDAAAASAWNDGGQDLHKVIG